MNVAAATYWLGWVRLIQLIAVFLSLKNLTQLFQSVVKQPLAKSQRINIDTRMVNFATDRSQLLV